MGLERSGKAKKIVIWLITMCVLLGAIIGLARSGLWSSEPGDEQSLDSSNNEDQSPKSPEQTDLDEADPQEQFLDKAQELYFQGQYDELIRVVQDHRETFPDNVWNDWYEGRALLELDRYDPACELLLRASESFGDDQMRKEAFGTFAMSSRKFGKSAPEIYTEVLATSALVPRFVFHLLADQVKYPEGSEGLDELSELIELHRLNHPDDPWLYFYLGHFELYRVEAGGDLAAAKYYSQGYSKAKDSEMRDLLRSRAVGHYCVGGKTRYAYQKFGDDPATFRELVLLLTRDYELEELAWLQQEHRSRHPNDPNLIWADTHSAWERGDYPRVVELVSTHEKVLIEHSPDSQWKIHNWWFRSLVRTRQFEAAWELADRIEPQWGDDQHNQYHVVVLAARAQAERVIKILEQLIQDEEVTPFWIYLDEDLSLLLEDSSYDAFRAKYPRDKALDDAFGLEEPEPQEQDDAEFSEAQQTPEDVAAEE